MDKKNSKKHNNNDGTKKLIPGEKKIIVTHGKVKKDTNNYRHRQK